MYRSRARAVSCPTLTHPGPAALAAHGDFPTPQVEVAAAGSYGSYADLGVIPTIASHGRCLLLKVGIMQAAVIRVPGP
jgi:hypothetical protein